MYYLVDIIALLFVLFFTVYGFIAGFYRSTIDFILAIVCFGGAIGLSYLVVFNWFDSVGWLSEFTLFILDLLGNSKISGADVIIKEVAYYIAVGVLMAILTVVFTVLLNVVRNVLLNGVIKARKKRKLLKKFGNFLGGIVNFILSSSIVLFIMAVPHAFKESDIMFRRSNEILQASEVLSLVYDDNPFNSIVESLGITDIEETLIDIIKE